MYIFNENKVFADFADDQYIVLNHVNGEYYSFDRASSAVLKALVEGCSAEDITESLCSRYDWEPCKVQEKVSQFIERLLQRQILLSGECTKGDAGPYIASLALQAMPELGFEVFTDVADLLLMDPIHEVDEKAGWPFKKS